MYIRPNIEKRVKSDSKIYKETNQRHLKDNQFGVNRLLPFPLYFLAKNRQRTTFAAAHCIFVRLLSCWPNLETSPKKKTKNVNQHKNLNIENNSQLREIYMSLSCGWLSIKYFFSRLFGGPSLFDR